MKVSLFDFDLPESAIATRPTSPRDAARLLEVGATLTDRVMTDLPQCLEPGDRLVFNDTKVIPAQLNGKIGDRRVSVTLHRRLEHQSWQAFVRPGRVFRPGGQVIFGDDFRADIVAVEPMEAGGVTLSFPYSLPLLRARLEAHGTMPLPPYIQRNRAPDAQDAEDYQTLFAAREGAVAAPTAGLHFTPRLMSALAERNIAHSLVTLHVGAGTFLPVRVEDTAQHRMHAVWGEISAETAAALNATRRGGGRIIPVGTTSLRLLETAAGGSGEIRPFSGESEIFITPGYRFRAADLLITNFHLPRSTLMMLVAAFAGFERIRHAYAHAIDRGYRFYSYGDACLLHRDAAAA